MRDAGLNRRPACCTCSELFWALLIYESTTRYKNRRRGRRTRLPVLASTPAKD